MELFRDHAGGAVACFLRAIPMNEPYSHPGSAQVYDAVYTRLRDYAADAAKVLEIVRQMTDGRDPGRMSLLDVACGTGRHLEYLAREFSSVAGVDLSQIQLAAARDRLGPAIPLHHGDMLRLRQVLEGASGEGRAATFDVVICLFSSISCLGSRDELATAIDGMASVLRPGGVLLIEPWLRPDAFRASPIISYFVDQPDLKVARMCSPSQQDDVTVLDMHHLVARPGAIDYYVEAHRLHMFTEAELDHAFREAGMIARFDPAGLDAVGRGIWIASKPA